MVSPKTVQSSFFLPSFVLWNPRLRRYQSFVCLIRRANVCDMVHTTASRERNVEMSLLAFFRSAPLGSTVPAKSDGGFAV
jgi:hypothetical protein